MLNYLELLGAASQDRIKARYSFLGPGGLLLHIFSNKISGSTISIEKINIGYRLVQLSVVRSGSRQELGFCSGH